MDPLCHSLWKGCQRKIVPITIIIYARRMVLFQGDCDKSVFFSENVEESIVSKLEARTPLLSLLISFGPNVQCWRIVLGDSFPFIEKMERKNFPSLPRFCRNQHGVAIAICKTAKPPRCFTAQCSNDVVWNTC